MIIKSAARFLFRLSSEWREILEDRTISNSLSLIKYKTDKKGTFEQMLPKYLS